MPIVPPLFWDDDLKSFLGMEYMAVLVVDLRIEFGEGKAFANVIFDKGGGAKEPLKVVSNGI